MVTAPEERPINLYTVLSIINAFDQEQGRLSLRSMASNPEEEQELNRHASKLGDFGFFDLAVNETKTGKAFSIVKLWPTGEQLAELLTDSEIFKSIVDAFGVEINPRAIEDVISLGGKTLDDLLKADPERKKARQERRAEKNEVRKAKKSNVSRIDISIGEAKREVIEYAREQIPDQYSDYIRIPATPEAKQLYLESSRSKFVLEFIEKEYGQKSVRTNISSNSDFSKMRKLELFHLHYTNLSTLGAHPKVKDVDRFLNQSKLDVRNNILEAILNKKSVIADYLKKVQTINSELFPKVDVRQTQNSDFLVKENVAPYAQTELPEEEAQNIVNPNDSVDSSNKDSLTESPQFENESNYTTEQSLEDLATELGLTKDSTVETGQSIIQDVTKSVVDLGQDLTFSTGGEAESGESVPGEDERNMDDSSTTEIINNPLQLTQLYSDSAHKGQDLLGFQQDIEAFASIVALKELTPPLAIALFGQWGTGKSFFMQKLSEKVKELAETQGFLREEEKEQSEQGIDRETDEKPFCEGVCQIHFNAWSYMDTNLWASLVTRIFEGLEEYITDDNRAKKEKAKIEKKLSKELQLSKQQERELSALKKEKEDEYELLKSEKSKRSRYQSQAVQAVRDASVDQVIDALKKELEESGAVTELKTNLSSLGIDAGKMAQWSPQNILGELTAWKTFGLEFLKMSSSQWWKLGGLALLILALAVVPGIVNPSWNFQGLSFLGITGSAIVAMWEKARGTLAKLNPVIKQVTEYKNKYEERKAQLLSEQEQRIAALRLRMEQNRLEIQQVEQKLQGVQKEIHQLNHSLKHTLSQKALYSFILERSQSSDYEQHLGIISTIRRDFETLSFLFIESLKELEALEAKKETEDLDEREMKRIESRIKDLEEYREMSQDFDKPLERIILYVDDLDRCPEERVVEVLEAVNLLMAFPLFIVVVGVDPRWVKNALIKKYRLQFTGHIEGMDLASQFDLEVINPSDYLEKIFQIPFHLMSPSNESIQGMIEHLVGDSVLKAEELEEKEAIPEQPQEPEELEEAEEIDVEEEVEMAEEEAEAENEPDYKSDPEAVDETTEKAIATKTEKDGDGLDTTLLNVVTTYMMQEQESELPSLESASITVLEKAGGQSKTLKRITPESLKLHPAELQYMKDFSWLIGNTPRTVKRFVNMYRIIRAHERLSYKDEKDKVGLLLIIFILTLRTGKYSKYSDDIFDSITIGTEKTIKECLEEEYSSERVAKDVDYNLFVYELRTNEELELVRAQPNSSLDNNIDFVKRFSFKIPNQTFSLEGLT